MKRLAKTIKEIFSKFGTVEKGFSVIDLLLGMAIVGIFVAVLIVSINGFSATT